MEENFNDKRQSPRVNKELKVDFEFFHLEEKIKYGYGSSTASMDVSINGMKLIDAPDADISMEKPIEMTITVPDTHDVFQAIGQVKWQKEVYGIKHFGVEIINMSDWEKFKSIIQ